MFVIPVFVYPIALVLLFVFILLVWWFIHRERFPYASKQILTHREYKFYMTLRKVAQKHRCIVCPKVGLKDLLQVTDRKDYMKYFRRISQKHVDFVICDEKLNVLFAIELDDSSHLTPQVKQRDRFKDRAFSAAGIPLKRIWNMDETSINALFDDI